MPTVNQLVRKGRLAQKAKTNGWPEKERQSAERAGDGETARLDQIRIKRLRKRGEALRQELAGPAPATDELPAAGPGAPPGAP